MKTFRFLFLALALMLSMNASAHDFKVDGIYYNITSSSDLTVSVTYQGYYYDSYSNEYSGSVVIPEKVTYNSKEYSVTSIGAYAFRDCSGLTSVTIPNSVTSIGEHAFSGCSGLTAVHITDLSAWCKIQFVKDVYYVYPNPTFYAHHLYLNGEEITNLVIPDDVTSIGDSAFSGCSSITSVTIPNSVTSIGGSAFYGCSGLTSVDIPNSVTSIGGSAFYGCSGLTSVDIPNSVTSIGGYAFRDCSGLTSVTIPNSVTSIGEDAFAYCSGLTAVHITDLSAWCKIKFYDVSSNPTCNARHLYLNGEEITNLVIPDDVTYIEKYAFSGCDGLTSVTIPNSIKSIGISAFDGCDGLTNIRFEDGDESINIESDHGDRTFEGCPIETLYIGRNFSALEFSGKSTLSTIIIGNSVTKIDLGVFKDCTGLTNFRIEDGDSNITISNTTFSQCPLGGVSK